MSSYTYNGRAVGWYRQHLERCAQRFAELVKDGTIPAEQVPDIVATLDSAYSELVAEAMIADAITLKAR